MDVSAAPTCVDGGGGALAWGAWLTGGLSARLVSVEGGEGMEIGGASSFLPGRRTCAKLWLPAISWATVCALSSATPLLAANAAGIETRPAGVWGVCGSLRVSDSLPVAESGRCLTTEEPFSLLAIWERSAATLCRSGTSMELRPSPSLRVVVVAVDSSVRTSHLGRGAEVGGGGGATNVGGAC